MSNFHYRFRKEDCSVKSGRSGRIYNSSHLRHLEASKKWRTPLYITSAEGVYLYDVRGTPYLDFSSQLMGSNLGHGNEAMIDYLSNEEMRRIAERKDGRGTKVTALLEDY